jgi:hypothetical protein
MATKSKKVRKPKVKTSKPKTKCLLTYVENSSPKAKLFSSEKQMNDFIEDFETKHAEYGADDGYWIDICVTGITGRAVSLDQSYNPFEDT